MQNSEHSGAGRALRSSRAQFSDLVHCPSILSEKGVPLGQHQGNTVTWFSPRSFILKLCHSALWFPAETLLHVTNCCPPSLTNPSAQESSEWPPTYHTSGGWQGKIPKSRIRVFLT